MFKKRTIVILSAFLVILGLFLTLFLVITDIASMRRGVDVDLSSPESMVESLQTAINRESFIMLDKIFDENHYTSVFGEMLFGKDIEVSYGFSEHDKINRKKVLTTKDLDKIKKGELKYISDNAAIGFLVFQERFGQETEMLTSIAFLTQKKSDGWKITKMYDFIYSKSDFFEVEDFKLHHIDNSFAI
ncbi:MAG: hypothetical protein ACOCUR_00920, partial [Nanoarchaeota archaeon]